MSLASVRVQVQGRSIQCSTLHEHYQCWLNQQVHSIKTLSTVQPSPNNSGRYCMLFMRERVERDNLLRAISLYFLLLRLSNSELNFLIYEGIVWTKKFHRCQLTWESEAKKKIVGWVKHQHDRTMIFRFYFCVLRRQLTVVYFYYSSKTKFDACIKNRKLKLIEFI